MTLHKSFVAASLKGDVGDYRIKRNDDTIWIHYKVGDDEVTIFALSIEDPHLADTLAARLMGMFHDRMRRGEG